MIEIPAAWTGTITGRRVQVGVRFDATLAELPELRFTIVPGLGETIQMAAEEVRPLPEGGAAYSFTLPDGYIRSIHTRLATSDGAAGAELAFKPGYEILDLMPKSLNGLLPLTFMRKNRIRHVGTLQFMAEQVSTSEEYNPFVQIEAVKVLSYMTIEEGDPEAIAWALRLLDAQFERIDAARGGVKGSSKEHPLHIVISLRFIRILALLMVGRAEEALAEMAVLDAHVEAVSSVPIIAFNLSLGLMLHGWILARGGETAGAIRRLEFVIACFRAASQTMPAAKSKIFAELGMALQAATVAIDMVAGLKGRMAIEWDGYHGALTIAKRFSRLTNTASQERLALRLTEAAEQLANRQAALVPVESLAP